MSKTREGTEHPDRDAQFGYLHRQVKAHQKAGQPNISVDCKKKELVGDFKNGGREWQLQGQPEEVRVHDFQDPELGKAVPYGVFDIGRNEGGSMWEGTTTPPSLLLRAFAAGGMAWGEHFTPAPTNSL